MVDLQDSICRVCPHRGESVFSGLQEARLNKFCGLKHVGHYKKDQRIFYEGEPALGLFILCSGKVKLSRSSKVGRKQILGITGPCGLLEEKDLFIHDRRSVTAEAMEDSTVCFVRREDFIDFLRLNPEVALKMVEQLSRELEEAENRIEALSALDSRRRVAQLLLSLSARYGRDTADGRLIDIRLTREEMAELVGATQETVIRVLSGFKREMLIAEVDKNLLLKNEDRLKRMARHR